MGDNIVKATNTKTVAVIGTGLIGRGWAIVFARAGYTVRMYDARAGACAVALTEIERRLRDLERYGLVSDPAAILARLEPASSLADATRDAELVQECVFETLPVKRALFEELDRVAPVDSILASSSSAIVASAFSRELTGRGRCLVGHPANPPYLMPIVEVAPSEWTSPGVVQRANEIYRQAGQEPIVVERELHGFILNRLQGALLNEAFRLVEEGYADTEAIDKTVAFGLGLRWSFMGPFETIDLNATGDQSPEAFAKFLPDIKRRSNVVINITTGGAPTITIEERVRPAATFAPELASLNLGSMNFGIFGMLERFNDLKHDWERRYLSDKNIIFQNTYGQVEHVIETGAANGTRFEFECYDTAQAAVVHSDGLWPHGRDREPPRRRCAH